MAGSTAQSIGTITDLVMRISDGRTPQEIEQDPQVRLELAKAMANHSPAGLALVSSRGKWKMAAHHDLMNRKIVETINKDEGRLIISVSIRSGKSLLAARYAIAWYLGTHPDSRVILGTHEAGLSAGHAGFARDKLVEYGQRFYGVTVNPASSARDRWDILGHDGGIWAGGVGGSPIGVGADALFIDDPYRNYKHAMSDVGRAQVQEWWSGTLESRVEAGGSVIVICSRWHEKDLPGWLMETYPGEWDEIHIPALCDDPSTDVLGRQKDESYWPERWSADRLKRQRARLERSLPFVWLAQYQQRPSAPEGGVFPIGKMRAVTWTEFRAGPKLVALCRAWDLGATEGGGDYTVGLLLGRYEDGRWIILDMVRGQWGAAIVQQQIRDTRAADDKRWGAGKVQVQLPQDPGQAGKAQAGQMTAMLSGAAVSAAPETGRKDVRAFGASAQVQSGNMDYIESIPDSDVMLEELRAFPRGAHDDIVDTLSGAFNRIVGSVVVSDPVSDAMLGMTRNTELT